MYAFSILKQRKIVTLFVSNETDLFFTCGPLCGCREVNTEARDTLTM